jgi:hypothetical protein
MVHTRVVINGENLDVVFNTSYEVSVTGKVTVAVFLKSECIDLLYYVSPFEFNNQEVGSTIFTGKDMTVVYKSPTMVLFSGDVERITFINPKGDVIKTYRLNDCDKEFAFVEEK